MLKVTTRMASRWVKAAFLALLGIIILLYADRLVDDLKNAMEGNLDVAFEWTWDLLTILLWVLVAWLFVDAVLTVALSFSEDRYTFMDVMYRLARIEKKLGIPAPREFEKEELEREVEPEAELEVVPPEPAVEEEPPPP